MSGSETSSNKPLRVLCLDHEGGHGGSSRSLYAVLRHAEYSNLQVEVWGRRNQGIKKKYNELSINFELVPELPVFSVFSTSILRNLSVIKNKIIEFILFWKSGDYLVHKIKNQYDIVHFNHVSFFLLAWYLRKKTGIPAVMHIRTRPYDSTFARWQAKIIKKSVDKMVFITENEKHYMESLVGSVDGEVIHNISTMDNANISASLAVPKDERLKVISLSNYHYVRGVDLLVDVARSIRARNRGQDILFVLAGDMKLTRGLPGRLGELGQAGGTLIDYINEQNVSDMFLSLGHVEDPESVIAASDVTIKLSRDHNPWGRDIIEAMTFGRPVIALGSWDGFVRQGQTGFLFSEFDSDAIAVEIINLADDRNRLHQMGMESRRWMSNVCDGPTSARRLTDVWSQTVTDSSTVH